MSMSTIKKLAFCLFSMSASLVLVAGGLPAGYHQISYIQGNGSNARFVTDYVPHPTTDKIEAVVSFPSTGQKTVWCARGAGAYDDTFTVILDNTSSGSIMGRAALRRTRRLFLQKPNIR